MRERTAGYPGKRLLDLVVLFLALPVLLPLLLIVAVLVRVKLGSPVIFRQQRPGLKGKPFELLKFRSMTDARDENGELLPDHVRLTAFGKLLRSTSLDELPEILNVLRGEMSLVGPRPLLMHYLPLYNETQARRHDVLPGISGWAQVNGRNAVSWSERFAMDVWYVDHASAALDMRIMLMSIGKVLNRSGVSAEGHATMPPFTGSEEESA